MKLLLSLAIVAAFAAPVFASDIADSGAISHPTDKTVAKKGKKKKKKEEKKDEAPAAPAPETH